MCLELFVNAGSMDNVLKSIKTDIGLLTISGTVCEINPNNKIYREPFVFHYIGTSHQLQKIKSCFNNL